VASIEIEREPGLPQHIGVAARVHVPNAFGMHYSAIWLPRLIGLVPQVAW
jgi:hypothetical protein